MLRSLYRNMSVEEAQNVLESRLFTKPTNKIYLPRKWFSTSLFRSHYFKSPFYTGETTILKVEVNEGFFQRIFKEGTFILKEPNGFYGYPEVQDEILYAKAHKTIDSLYNVGFLDLDRFNSEVLDIREIKDKEYLSYLENSLIHHTLDMEERKYVEDSLDFYFQVSYDIAILLLKYQTLMLEAINPVIKTLHFSKDIKDLKKKNLDKYSVTLRIRFMRNVKNYSLFHEEFFSLNSDDIIRLLPYVERIDLYSLEEAKQYKEYLHVKGDNDYTKHEKRERKKLNRLSFLEFKEVTDCLFKDRVVLSDLVAWMPFFNDIKDINQVDPRQIDNLESHTMKCLNISNLVANYFKDQGVLIDSKGLVYLKWLLLLHDIGKPYCECNNITSRYSQFGEKDKITLEIMAEILDEDMLLPIKQIFKIFSLSSLSGFKKIRNLIINILKEIMNSYNVNYEEAGIIISNYLVVALLGKVSHTASLKPHAYCASYVDDLMFFDRVNDVLRSLKINDFQFPYLDYYARVDNAYDEVVEPYYINDKKTILDIIREMPLRDGKDLTFSFANKKGIERQINYLDIVDTYFRDDNWLFSKYFIEVISDGKVHGNAHSNRVLAYSYVMGMARNKSNEDMEILALASLYHDIGRNNTNHSLVSVEMLREGNLIPKRIEEYVYFIIEAHGYNDTLDDKVLEKYKVDRDRALELLRIFKDADALDRLRYDIASSEKISLNIDYLRTEESKQLIMFASALNAMFKINKLALAPSLKKIIKN